MRNEYKYKKVLNIYSKKVFAEVANNCGFNLVSNKQKLPDRHFYMEVDDSYKRVNLRCDVYQREDIQIIFHFVLSVDGKDVSEWYMFVKCFSDEFHYPINSIYTLDDYRALATYIQRDFRREIVRATNKLRSKIIKE
jgi:hypothetical protein